MPFPSVSEVGWNGGTQQTDFSAQPPQYVLDQIGGSYDQSRYYWNPDTFSLVDRYTGGSYQYSRQDPANGTNVITNYGNDAQQTLHYGAGQTPYFGFGDSAQGYNAGDAPNSGTFISADPNAIADYQSHRQDVVNQGIAKVGALVGGTALASALQPAALTSGSGTASITGAPINSLGATGISQAGQDMTAVLGAGGGTAAGVGSKFGNFLNNWGPEIAGGVNALLGYRASGQAADAETAAYQQAIDEQRRQYDQTRADLQPWMTAGQGALNNLQNPAASFAASPGYAWARSEGQRDIGNSFAARGGAASGNALRALSEFNTGLAQQDYGNWWNQQAGLAGVGQNATTNVANFGQNTAGNVGNYLAGQGASRASGVLGKYGSIAGGANDALTNYLYRRRVA
jgi:hypothetical protein